MCVAEDSSQSAAAHLAVAEHTAQSSDGRTGAHSTPPSAQQEPPPPAAVKTEPKPEPKPDPEMEAAPAPVPAADGGGDRPDLSARGERTLTPAAAAASAAARADAEIDRLFDEPLGNGHGAGGDAAPAPVPAARARVEDDLQSAIKSILNLPRTDSEPTAMLPPPLPPSRFNINASFFNADGATEDSEALDEAVRSILL